MRVLFAVQSFKGTLDSVDAANIAKEEFREAHILPVTDGGNGFLNTIAFYRNNGRYRNIFTTNANGNRIRSRILEFSDSIFIESAEIIGKHRIKKQIPILQRSTSGIGAVINHALKRKKRIFMGLGGSYTADMGFGMLKTIGCNVCAYNGTAVLKSGEQCNILSPLSIIPDVRNILEGKKGAIVYAKQKHASASEMQQLEKYFNSTAINIHMERTQYAGAAGGLGAACLFAGAGIRDNMDFMDSISDIRRHIMNADIIITSEGMIDRQSFYGKITGEIIDFSLEHGKRVIVIAGKSTIKRKDIDVYTMGTDGMKDAAGSFRNILRKMRKDL